MVRYKVFQHRGSGAVRVKRECYPGLWVWVKEPEKVCAGEPPIKAFESVAEAQAWVDGRARLAALQDEALWQEVQS